MLYVAETDVGVEREGNEDNLIAVEFVAPKGQGGMPIHHQVFIVADGMGGLNKGELASAFAVRNVIGNILNRCITAKATQDGREENVEPLEYRKILVESIQAANTVIHRLAQEEEGLGSTIVVAWVVDDRELYVGHVGDTRAYLFREDRWIQITRDHSEVQDMVDAGIIRPEEARGHFRRNVITRSLGGTPEVEVDVNRKFNGEAISLQEGDLLLLCSDGLNGEITDEEMKQIIRDAENATSPGHGFLVQACRGMVEAAKAKGGRDNITVVLGYRGPQTASPEAEAPVQELADTQKRFG